MRDETRRETEARLRAMLRAGDPAGEGGSLPPERVREMRRRVLGSLPERRRPPFLWAAGVASAAMAVLALVVTLALHREVPPPGMAPMPPMSPEPPALSPTAPSPEPPLGTEAASTETGRRVPPPWEGGGRSRGEARRGASRAATGLGATATPLLPSPLSQPSPSQGGATPPGPSLRPKSAPMPEPPAPAATAPEAPSPEAAPAPPAAAPLQIQFNTPGGTRVIWVLAPADPS